MTVIVVDTPTRVSARTTSETTQKRVLSMVMMRVSPEVILETGSAWMPSWEESTASTTEGMGVEEVSTEYSTTSYPAFATPVRASTSAPFA